VSGVANIMYDNGLQYVGEFKNDMREGWGKLYYNNGDVYKGNFEKDLRHGSGLLRSLLFTYKGDWYNDNF